MVITRRTIETLVDLVENKLSMMSIFDRDDRAEHLLLTETLRELTALRARPSASAMEAAAPRELRPH